MQNCNLCVNQDLCEEWYRLSEYTEAYTKMVKEYENGGTYCKYFISQSDIRMMQ